MPSHMLEVGDGTKAMPTNTKLDIEESKKGEVCKRRLWETVECHQYSQKKASPAVKSAWLMADR